MLAPNAGPHFLQQPGLGIAFSVLSGKPRQLDYAAPFYPSS